MTMCIVFTEDKDGYKVGQSCYVERTLARRFCENGVAITHQRHLDLVYDAKQAEKKLDEERKAEFLAKKEKAKSEKGFLKKVEKREKAVKK